ncbi:MAG TPA: hypothetical protein VFN09_03315 [Rhodanobacteraceae bacterium]|nr:hypothetical protein [Rhodanobacteraceae bacterium]
MSLRWHPWLDEARLSAPRLGVRACAQILWPEILLVLAGNGLIAGHLAAATPWWFPLVCAVLGVASLALTQQRLAQLTAQWQSGWWAAAAIPSIAAARTRWLLCLLAALAGALLSLPLPLLFSPFTDGDRLARSCGLVAAALAGGALAAGFWPTQPTRRHAKLHLLRTPLLPLPGLDARDLPTLATWQRRETMQRWRRGSQFGLLGGMLAMLPSGTSTAAAIGLLLLVGTIAWLTVVMAACADVADAAARLLAATPVAMRRARRHAWRYPAFSLACASLWMLVAVVLLNASMLLAAGWLLVVMASSVPAMWRLSRVFVT